MNRPTPSRLARALSIAVLGLPLTFALPAFAQTDDAPADRPDATTLDTIHVEAEIIKRSQTVTKTDTPIIEVPQSVSVVGAQQFADRGLHGIDEAFWYLAGTRGAGYGQDTRSDWLLVRGFTPARYMDGLAMTDGTWTGATRVEPYGLEQMDVLKGPSSVSYGAMPPGGLVNLVSKRPTDVPLREVVLQVGNFNLRSGAFDFGGPLDADGTWSYRLTGLARNSDNLVDFVEDDRYYFAPALAWKPSEATSLTLLARWQKADTANGSGFLPAAGTLLPSPHGKISPSVFTGEPGWNDYIRTSKSVGYEFEHAFANGIEFRQNLRYEDADVDHDAGVGTLALQEDGRTLNRYLFPLEEHSRSFAVDNNLTFRFDTGAWEHTVLAGIDYRRLQNDYASAFGFGIDPIDVFDPVYGAEVIVPDYTFHEDKVQEQTGVYLQDQMRLDRWVITVAGRHDEVRTRTDNLIADPITRTRQEDDAFSGRVGVNYVFDSGFAPYVAWSESFQPTVGVDFDGNAFVPTTGEQVEAGIKYLPTDGHGLLTLAVYDIRQENTLSVDPDHVLFSVQQGETRVRGVELEGRWNFTPTLAAYGSATWMDTEVTRTTDAAALGKQVALVPERQAALGLDYTIAYGPLSGLGFGGGARYTGAVYGDIYNEWRTPSHTLFDANVHYEFDRWRFQINAANLFDKEYIAVCNSAMWCYYGHPRTVTATARYRW